MMGSLWPVGFPRFPLRLTPTPAASSYPQTFPARQMLQIRLCTLFVVTVAIAGCGASDLGPVQPESGFAIVTEHRVDPSATGAAITNGTGPHVVVAPPAAKRSQRLLVFLPGTGGRPDFYTSIVRHAAQRGHFAIALAYPNAEAVNDLCASMPSATCQEDVRIEVITGAPRSSLV